MNTVPAEKVKIDFLFEEEMGCIERCWKMIEKGVRGVHAAAINLYQGRSILARQI